MKVDFRILLKVVALSPRQFVVFVGGLIIPFMGIKTYVTQANKDWRVTEARLLDITVHERVFSDTEKVNYLKMTYEYSTEKDNYRATSEQVQYSSSRQDSRMEEIKKDKSTIAIYYEGEDPSTYTFYKYETEPEAAFLMLIPTGLIMSIVGYWLMKVRYEYLGP